MNNVYHAIGIMSGTSLDGLDVAVIKFEQNLDKWSFKVINASTFDYTTDLKKRLSCCIDSGGFELIQLSNDWAYFASDCINKIKKQLNFKIDLIGSHGHTVFHQIDKKLTYQLGNAAIIAVETGIKTVSDFRSSDVALGGQGAPLVPIGDQLLFSEYDACLNLGGIANISFLENGQLLAFDVCPFNIPMNLLANQKNKEFDKNGEMAQKGTFQEKLLQNLKSLAYFQQASPKSLGVEWINKNFNPLLNELELNVEDKLSTLIELFSDLIATEINSKAIKNILISGGGTHNNYFINQLKSKTNAEIILPKSEIIEFKEAIIFAFLGLLRVLEIPNTITSVTAAKRAHCSGAIYLS